MIVMTTFEHVLRVQRTDSHENYIFLNVSSNGPDPLDVKLQATEGESPYTTNLQSSRISSLREKKSAQTDSDWENTLLMKFLQRSTIYKDNDQDGKSIEMVASLSPSRVTLVFRKNISGITQRLGEINLHQNDDLELDTLGWTSVAILRGDALESKVAELTAMHTSSQETVSALKRQVEELIAAKEVHENTLIAKFKDLLNAKKRKIRDQERLLAGANVASGRAQQIQVARRGENINAPPAPATAPRQPTESRRGKRKANDAALEEPDNDLVKDEVPASDGPSSPAQVKVEDIDEDEVGMLQTPDASDEDLTVDEDEGEEGAIGGGASQAQPTQDEGSPPSTSDLPPDRELPFDNVTAKRQEQAVPKKQEADEDEETEDEDDEL